MYSFLAPILLIILGIILISVALRLFLRALINLSTYVAEEGARNVNFTAGFMQAFTYCPPIGLALILIGVHYLPAI